MSGQKQQINRIYGENMEENKIILEEITQEEETLEEIKEENVAPEEVVPETTDIASQVADSEETVKAPKKGEEKATKKDILVCLSIALGALVIIIAIILGSVFGIAGANAKDQLNVEMEVGEEWSKNYLCSWLNSRNSATNDNLDLPEGTFEYDLVEFELKKFDKDLKVERPIEDSHYVYTYTFVVRDEKYAVTLNAATGQILEVEIID